MSACAAAAFQLAQRGTEQAQRILRKRTVVVFAAAKRQAPGAGEKDDWDSWDPRETT